MFVQSAEPQYLDSLYAKYKAGEELDESWNQFFAGFEYALDNAGSGGGGVDQKRLQKEFNVFRLIQSFRARGHLLSDTNPIRPRKDRKARISLPDYGLEEADLDIAFHCGHFVGMGDATLRKILEHLQSVYCGHIGIEYMHSNNTEIRRWVRDNFELRVKNREISIDKKKRILHKLNQASVFENFLQTKYVGQKRFSLEGGETTIPALDAIINQGAELGAREFVIGMAHRGRLNVLANIIGKTYEFIFSEFEGQNTDFAQVGHGDVKYHLGYTSEIATPVGKNVYVKLMHNPSHLETVNSVVLGYSRAQSDMSYANDYDKVIPILIHGDAAIAGQGVVYETIQMSKLDGYAIGGTIHFIINNQIGFTTDFEDARSSNYCTSVARTLEVPIIHVNGDDPEAVVFAVELAVEFRQKFHEDIFIDMVCYRKHGHNEGDEPKYTQPHLYGLISKQKNPREIYLEQLVKQGSIESNLAMSMQEDFINQLNDRFNNVRQKEIPKRKQGPHKEWLNLDWAKEGDFERSPETGVGKDKLDKIIKAITNVPEGFNTLKKAQKLLEERKNRYETNQLDWATAELLAYGSLLMEGNNVRFSGQDVIRGTFSHRHAKVFDEMTNEKYCGLSHIEDKQGKINIYNSLLSEYAVLGFEHGYSLASPRSLNIWEAQFGDFANGAQIMIDQYIVASEAKWKRMSGLVVLLPHGYEGQGPEHSNARPERFLQLCAENNIIAANVTTPAQFFHLLRRQLAWSFRKPLIVFTPKSLLRDPRCTSSVQALTTGSFSEILDDTFVNAKDVKKVLVCTGKVYYDLLERQQKEGHKDVAVVRMEQIYPLATQQIQALKKKYPKAKFVWVQEEPLNMGAWTFLLRFRDLFGDWQAVGRAESASPATGFMSVHQAMQQKIVNDAFKL